MIRAARSLALLIPLAGGTVGCTSGGGSAGPVALSGEEVYRRSCSQCHQLNGQGLPGAFPTLVGAKWVTGDPETVVRIVVGGLAGPIEVKGETYKGLMPAHVPLTDESIARVLTYVRSSWGNQASAVDAALVAKIRAEQRSRGEMWTAPALEAAQAPQ